MIKVKLEGFEATKAWLMGQGKQVRYAASRALNSTAFAVNAQIKADMQRTFQGGATPFTLRAFKVEKAARDKLTATVALRTDGAGAGGAAYSKVLGHLFTGQRRSWKKVEGKLRGMGILPEGMTAAPGAACKLDAFGNIRRTEWAELLGAIKSNIRNVRLYKGRGKATHATGYFVLPKPYRGHGAGIWRRIERGSGGTVQPIIMFVPPVAPGQKINLQRIAQPVVDRVFKVVFDVELAMAMRSAR